MDRRTFRLASPMLVLGIASVLVLPRASAEDIRFSRDVLPILSDRCFHCHGPDADRREADLRLDQREDATADRGGYAAVAPGDPQASELLARLTTDDPDLRMPPADSHRKPLTADEMEILRKWVAEGAHWGRHWAFEAPLRSRVPELDAHPIDAFVKQRLALEEPPLTLSPAASREKLIRRLSLDLTGLPPTLAEVDAFVADPAPDAYPRLVARLLSSPHYGERMAMWWLDAARYADTDGYQGDATRTNWPWRDWVVQAFNDNMPFDQFTIEQFAGDLIPNASAEQILATCFHRNHMTNGEGGRDPEESRVDYVIDRVNTTGTVWLGLTLGCAQCHSHKFDPISHADYYRLYAFFNSIDEDGRAGSAAKPYLQYRSPHAERAIVEAESVVAARKPVERRSFAQASDQFEPWLATQLTRVAEGFVPWQTLHAVSLQSVEGTELRQESDGTIQASGPNPRQDDYRIIAAPELSRVTGLQLEVFPHPSHTEGKLSRGASGEFVLTDVKLQVRREGSSQLRDIEIAGAVADVERAVKGRNYGNIRDTLDDDPRNGWTTESHDPKQPHRAVFALAEPLVLGPDEQLIFVMLHRSTEGDANIGRFRISATDQPGPAVESLEPMPLEALAAANPTHPSQVTGELRQRLLKQFLYDHEPYQEAQRALERAERQLADVKRAGGELNVMVLSERDEPRATHILERGVWNAPGEAVSPQVPAAVLEWPDEQTQTRLDLARWLVAEENPLTARVVVNHLWQLCFGAGLVRTPEDFGLQGELPTHPELLDWLAVELVEHDWDLQHILRLIVTSQTYRQASEVSPELQARDPENRLWARGARFRLPSWMIRDAALRTSGLLNPAVGGPPVMPYQPEGVWAEMFMGRYRYEPSQGTAQYRRTLYAFWRRSSAPTFLFDSAQRRVCEVGRRETNTPLQALTLLNDRSILESSRELARTVLHNHSTSEAQLSALFRKIVSRRPSDRELQVLMRQWEQTLKHYKSTPEDARRLLSQGQPVVEGCDRSRACARPETMATAMVVASLIFNLDEAMTHE